MAFKSGELMSTDKNQTNKRGKSLTLITDKFNATNLRLSAFICGLKFNKPRQPNFIKKLKNQSLFVNFPKKDGVTFG